MLHLPPTAISMPHFSLTEPYLLPSGNNWVGYWTSEAKSTRQRFANASEWGLSPPRPRGAGHRTKLLGAYHVAHSTSVRLIRGNQRRADASMCLYPTDCSTPVAAIGIVLASAGFERFLLYKPSHRWHDIPILSRASMPQETLPAAIGGWKNLRRLDLANNKLKEIPHEVSSAIRREPPRSRSVEPATASDTIKCQRVILRSSPCSLCTPCL